MKKTLFLFLHAVAAVCASVAAEYTWVNGSTDWESESSYVENGKPVAGDVVYFPANTTGRVDDASIAFVSTLSRIALQDPSSVLVIDISTNATLGCGVNRGSTSRAGTVYKRGAGTLQLALSDTYSYHTAWIIEEGDLKMPQDGASSSTQSYYGSITVNAGCTLYTMYHGRSRVSEILGMGLVTNVAETGSEFLDIYGFGTDTPSVFPGVIAGGTRVYSRGNVYLTGTNNTFLGTCSAYYYNSAQTLGITGLRKIGKIGEPSSSGVGSHITTREYSGCIRYLGDGETTDKVFQFDYSTTRPAEFDAGATGGITFTGDWKFPETSAPQMLQLVLNGSNTAECVFSNAFTSYTRGGTNFTYYIKKTGSGTWRFADHPDRKQTGVLAVEEGTVRFDSIAESNEVCSLGLSTTLYKDVTGVQDPANRVDYAFLLGGGEHTGTLEYTGADIALCQTRPLVVKGQGRLKNSGGQLRLSGVSSEGADASTLFLDGVSEEDNLLYDVTDGDGGTLSLVKEGSGKWILSGEQSLSGPVDVRAGTLVVKNLTGKPYTWFRFTMKENGYECDRYNTTGIGGDTGAGRRIYSLDEIALYDASNRRQNIGLGTNSTITSTLRPGNTLVENSKNLGYYLGDGGGRVHLLFNDIAIWSDAIVIYPAAAPAIDNPATHCPIVMRLTNGAPEIASYDLCAARGTNDNYFGRSPTAYSLEGSVDGIGWDLLDENNAAEIPPKNGSWYCDSATFTNGAVRSGFPVRGHSLGGGMPFRNVSSVSVAPGAKLVADGDVILKGLTVDATAGAGMIDGFSFAASGTLNIVNLPDSPSVTIPIQVTNSTDFAEAAGWELKVDGQACPQKVFRVSDQAIRIFPKGTMIVLQ